MSLEQLLFIALFILVPIVRTLAERRNKQRAEEAQKRFESLESLETPDPPSFERPAWSVPAPPPLRPPAPAPAPALSAPTPPAPSARPPTPDAARRPPPDLARNLRSARARTRAAVPRDRAELRRAFLLVEILGPPRALEPRR